MAEGGAPASTGPGKTKHLCGVPSEHCGGSLGQLSAGFKAKGYRVHNSPTEAFRCMGRYLVKIGYEKLSSREFRAPDGSGIRVLTKQSRYGGKLRPGKAGRNMPAGNRTGGCCTSS
jgi:hypothetical protein